MFALKHQLFDFLRIFGIRDRLRCPNSACRAVGTWKPHGGWLDWNDECPKRRWLCKWCGYYKDKYEDRWCQAGGSCWEFAPIGKRNTPQVLLRKSGLNPWRG